MGNFTGVLINKATGGLVRDADTSDRVILLVVGGIETGKLEYYNPQELNDITDLEYLGWDESKDLENKDLVYYQTSEVFRLSPERSVWLMLVPKSEKASSLLHKDEFVNAVRSINGVNTLGICSLTKDETITVTVQEAQKMVENFREDHLYIDAVILEGTGNYISSIDEAVDLRKLESENIAVVISHDPAQAVKDEAYKTHAAVGSALGMLSVRYVHENMGSVDIENHPRTAKGTRDYPLTDKLNGLWLDAELSNGMPFSQLSISDQKKLQDKGYNFVGSFQGYAGFFFSNSNTCTESGSDYAFIEYNAVWNKAARIIRNTLLPRVRSKVKADPSTGYISNTTISSWDALVKSALESMVNSEDIADFDIYINPKQMAVSDKSFNIKVRLVADGIVHEFEIDLGFTNKI